MKRDDFRFQKILWSLVIVFALFLCVARIVNQTSSILGGYGFFLIGGTLFSATGLILLILRLFRFLVKRESFAYILNATLVLAIGVLGVYLIFTATAAISGKMLCVYFIPVVLGVSMFLDIFAGKE